MKIAFVVHTAYPEFIGGREHHVHHLASELSKTDEVMVFAGSRTQCIQKKRINGYHLVSIPMLSIRLSQNPLQIYRIIPGLRSSLAEEELDLIHAFEYGSYSTDVAYLFSKKHHLPFFLTVYGYQLRSPLLRFLKISYDLLLGKSVLMGSKKIFCSSSVQLDEISKILKRTKTKGKLIHQGNGIPIRSYEDEDVKAPYLSSEENTNRIRLLTVARILPRKGVKELVLALDKVIHPNSFKDICLTIVGPDAGELSSVKNKVKALGLEEHVIIKGAIPHEQIKDYLRHCDIFVLFSSYEALPLALLEAMACGKPVIFTDLPCAENVIENGKDGILVKPDDIDALSEAILRLSRDRDLREFLGRNAKIRIRSFDSGAEARRIKQVYLQAQADSGS